MVFVDEVAADGFIFTSKYFSSPVELSTYLKGFDPRGLRGHHLRLRLNILAQRLPSLQVLSL